MLPGNKGETSRPASLERNVEALGLFKKINQFLVYNYVIKISINNLTNCAEVWKTGYECSINPGNENSKLEVETPKFPAKIDFTFTEKVQAFKLKLQTSDQIFCFRFWKAHNQLGGSFKVGRPLPLEKKERS